MGVSGGVLSWFDSKRTRFRRSVVPIKYYTIEELDALYGPAPVPERARCGDCRRELCEELDAYYGREPWLASLCDKCRRARKV